MKTIAISENILLNGNLHKIKSQDGIEGIISKIGKIAIPVPHGHRLYDDFEIIYLKALSNYTEIFTTNDGKIVLSKTLKYLHDILPKSVFVKCHRSYIINMHHVKEIHVKSIRPRIVITGDIHIPVSKIYKSNF